jgi:GNAT superfamily N-acetyltransferase
MSDIELMRVTAANLEEEHVCCAIGDDAENRARAATKKDWLADRFAEGHVFLKADLRGKAFIEYGPAEKAWFPVDAPGWLFAQCFWVAGRFAGTGIGARLLEAAERDAEKSAGLFFLAAAKGKKPFLSDGRYLASKGYEAVDEALGFALFAKAARKGAQAPRLSERARAGKLGGAAAGVDLFWSPQCPFAPATAIEMARAAEEAGIAARLHEVVSAKAARDLCAPPGIFQAYLDGAFLTHELMSGDKFRKLLLANGR